MGAETVDRDFTSLSDEKGLATGSTDRSDQGHVTWKNGEVVRIILMFKQRIREVIRAGKTSHNHNNTERPESPTGVR